MNNSREKGVSHNPGSNTQESLTRRNFLKKLGLVIGNGGVILWGVGT